MISFTNLLIFAIFQKLSKATEGSCNRWVFNISQSKSAAALFINKRKYHLRQYNDIFPFKTEYKHLGGIFQGNGAQNSHIQQVQAKCLMRLNIMPMLIGTDWDVEKIRF